MEKTMTINLNFLYMTLRDLTDSELKMLFFVYHYLAETGQSVLVHDQKMRDYAASMGYSRSAMNYSNLLKALSEKGYLRRAAKGVYYICNENLLIENSFLDNLNNIRREKVEK